MPQEAQKPCPKCKEMVASNATKCKHCGADLRNWFVRHKVITVLLILLALGAIISPSQSKKQKENSSNQPSTTQSTPTPEVAKEPTIEYTKITADKLASDYKANEIAADNAYKGKMVEVTGIVDSIGKGLFDEPYITLKTGEVLVNVQCYLKTTEADKAATLTQGQQVVIRGKADGLLINVKVKDCEIVTK